MKNYEFARKKGSKDKKPRKLLTANNLARLAIGTGIAVAGSRLYKNRAALNIKKNSINEYRRLRKNKIWFGKSTLKKQARLGAARQAMKTISDSSISRPIMIGTGTGVLITAGKNYIDKKRKSKK